MFDNVRRISRQLAAYGTADAAVLAVNVVLLPVYTRVLSTHEYGALALLLVVEAFLKPIFRWGLDASFLRLYYDYRTDEDRRALAGTVAGFLLVADGLLLLVLLAAAAPVNRLLFDSQEFATAYRLLLVNSVAAGFLFLPLTLLRIQERSRLFATLTFLRSFGTVVARLILVVGLRFGILGIVLADSLVTAALLVGMSGLLRHMLARRFSSSMLRDALAYGFPQVPFGVLAQTMAMADRFLLGIFLPLRDVGVYLIATTVAAVLKLYPVAFGTAWMPFAFEALDRRDAPRLYARIGSYAFAVLVFMTLAMAGVADAVIRLLLPSAFHAAGRLVPWLALGMAIQALTGFFATSINISKRTRIYPVATAVGAGLSVAANVLLIPRLGLLGAAVALVVSQTVTTSVTFWLAQRAYRIPYERRRLLTASAAGAAIYVAMMAMGPASAWSMLGVRASLLALFPVGLYAFKFFEPHEWEQIRLFVSQMKRTRDLSAAAAAGGVPLKPDARHESRDRIESGAGGRERAPARARRRHP